MTRCVRCQGTLYDEDGAEVCLNCGARAEPKNRQAWDYAEPGAPRRKALKWLESECAAWERAGMELPKGSN